MLRLDNISMLCIISEGGASWDAGVRVEAARVLREMGRISTISDR